MNPDKEGESRPPPFFKPDSLFNNLLNFEKKEVLSWKVDFLAAVSPLLIPCAW